TAGNNNLVAMQYSVQADVTAPTPVIAGPAATQNGAFAITVDFGEAVTGFALGDVTVGNGTASALVDNGGGNFGLTITPTADGAVTVDIAANIATDTAGNNNLVAMQYSVQADVTAPTPVIAGPAATQNGAFAITVDFGEAVTGFALGDVTVGNGTASALVDNGGGNFGLTITPTADGAVTVDIAANIATDTAGNNNLVATQYSVQANISGPLPIPVLVPPGDVSGPFDIQIDFGEPVTGFTLSDFIIVNGSVSDLIDLGNGLFSVSVTPETAGLVLIDIPAGAAMDIDGNPSEAMAQIQITNVPPTAIPVANGWFAWLLAGLLGFVGMFKRKRN
ncbi:MAG: Ig-like domain-containing protein, partial [bacterium]